MITKKDDLARYTDLTTGAAQFVAIESTNWKNVIDNPQYTFWSVDKPGLVAALAINTALSPTNNVNVRQAIVHAINYTDIQQKVLLGEATSFVGPGTPNFGTFYNPGDLPPYDYNLTQAEGYLAKAGYPNGTGLPDLQFRISNSPAFCATAAEIIQSDLKRIGINVVITTLDASTYYAPYGNYATNLQNAEQLGHLSFLGGGLSWAGDQTPIDNWVGFVNNASLWGNWAVYSNPKVNSAVSIVSKSNDINQIVTQLTGAETQIYNDAPYAWIATPKLWLADGSYVWNKALIKQVYFDPTYTGITTIPLFNTVVFA